MAYNGGYGQGGYGQPAYPAGYGQPAYGQPQYGEGYSGQDGAPAVYQDQGYGGNVVPYNVEQ